MQPLDQIAELGIFGVTHDMSFTREFEPFNEDSTSVAFAELINSGELSVEEAYRNFWSHEDRTLNQIFGVEGRMTLPYWENMIREIMPLLSSENRQKMILRLAECYFNVERNPGRHRYNLFVRDYEHCIDLAERYAERCTIGIIGDEALGKLVKEEDKFIRELYLMYMGKIGFMDPRLEKWVLEEIKDGTLTKNDIRYFTKDNHKGILLRLADMGDPNIEEVALYNLFIIGHYHPRMMERFRENPDLRQRYAPQIARCLREVPIEIIDMMENDDEVSRKTVQPYFLERKRLDGIILNLARKGSTNAKVNALSILGIRRHYDSSIEEGLYSSDPKIVKSALSALKSLDMYHPKVSELLSHQDKDIRKVSFFLLYQLRRYDETVYALLDSPKRDERQIGFDLLSMLSVKVEQSVEIIANNGQDKDLAISNLASCAGYDERIEGLLDHPNAEVRKSAAKVKILRGMYDKRFREIMADCKEGEVARMIFAIKDVGTYHDDIRIILSTGTDQQKRFLIQRLNQLGIYYPEVEGLVYSKNLSTRIGAAANINENERKDMDIFMSIISNEKDTDIKMYVDSINPTYDMLSAMIDIPRIRESRSLYIIGGMLAKLRHKGRISPELHHLRLYQDAAS